jgi:hypothetical protein
VRPRVMADQLGLPDLVAGHAEPGTRPAPGGKAKASSGRPRRHPDPARPARRRPPRGPD